VDLREIWSGGQTGVDRAAWDAGRELGIAIGGWVPKGRLAEDGPVPSRYSECQETATADYAERTTANVRDSDATLILFRGALTGGSRFTREEAERLKRPLLAVDLEDESVSRAATSVTRWLAGISGTRLNVAGPRASTDPGGYAAALAVLLRALAAYRAPD
jgi:putative molybdenum carrier protein